MNEYLNVPSNMAKIHTNGDFQLPPHLSLIEHKIIEAVNRRVTRLIVNMPPRHGKSEYISKYLPAWLLCNNPKEQVILVSYESTFAQTWCRKAKAVYKACKDYYANSDGVTMAVDQNKYWETSEGGFMDAVGASGPITGKGATVLIVDDPIKNDEVANSETQRNKIYEWFVSTAMTRLEPDAIVIIILTRWHGADLAGELIKQDTDNEWEVISIPAIAEDNDCLGREKGEPLWKERYNYETLMKIKKLIGSYWWSCLYQQNPISGEYQIFKAEWWKYYTEIPSGGLLIQSWDTAFKASKMNDYSVCETWLALDGDYYLIDVVRRKLEFPELFRTVVDLYDKFKPQYVLIEDEASGQSIIQLLQRQTTIPIKAIPALADKITRAGRVNMLHEGGKVFLPERAAWLQDFKAECESFPYGANDDQVDPMTQALSFLREAMETNNATIISSRNRKTKTIKEMYDKY